MELVPEGEEINDIATLQELASRAPVIKLLNMILLQGVREKASDIHFEPFEQDYRIRYRVDGVLYEVARPPKNLSLGLSSRIKVMANLMYSRTPPSAGRTFHGHNRRQERGPAYLYFAYDIRREHRHEGPRQDDGQPFYR
jgi:type IV pilus assembly protein PilB